MTILPKVRRDGRLGSLLWEQLQCIRERTPLISDNVEIVETPNGWMPRPRIKKQRGVSEINSVEIRQFRIFAVAGDVLHCWPVDHEGTVTFGVFGGTQIAKPYLLRRTPFEGRNIGGVTYTWPFSGYGGGQRRRARRTGFQFSQEVIPRYGVFIRDHPVLGDGGFDDTNPLILPSDVKDYSDIIYAARVFENGRPYQVTAQSSHFTPNGLDSDGVYWQDLNFDCRAWGTARYQGP